MYYPGCPLDFPLDPSETLTIRRILSPDRVPNKGKAVYRFDTWLLPFLEENGWEFVGQNQRDRAKVYLRSPDGQVVESFIIHVSIPNDDAILRVAGAMIKFVTRQPGPDDQWTFDGRIGRFRATFYKFGHRFIRGEGWDEDAIRRDRTPTLDIHMSGLWSVMLYWHDGFDNLPTWDRTEYFSALVPGLTSWGELRSDFAASRRRS